jgi:hypothetical protein
MAGGIITLRAQQWDRDGDGDLLRKRLIKMRNFGLRVQMSEDGAYDAVDLVAWLAWVGSQIEALDEYVDHGRGWAAAAARLGLG